MWRPSVWGTGPDEASWVYAANGALWTWVGFFLPLQIGRVAWEQRRWGLVAINGGFDLVRVLHHPLVLAPGVVMSAHQQLAAAVVLTAVESLARQVGDELEGEVYHLYRQGHALKDIAQRLNKPYSTIRRMVGRMEPDPRQFLMNAEHPFIQYCGIDAACLRQFVRAIEDAPERARFVLRALSDD